MRIHCTLYNNDHRYKMSTIDATVYTKSVVKCVYNICTCVQKRNIGNIFQCKLI